MSWAPKHFSQPVKIEPLPEMSSEIAELFAFAHRLDAMRDEIIEAVMRGVGLSPEQLQRLSGGDYASVLIPLEEKP